jgi:5'-3' exonuclease
LRLQAFDTRVRDLIAHQERIGGALTAGKFVGRCGQPPVLYDEAAVAQRFGLPADRLPEFVAPIGDSADNLKGVRGVGDKTAQRLITQFGSVEKLLERLRPGHVAKGAPSAD